MSRHSNYATQNIPPCTGCGGPNSYWHTAHYSCPRCWFLLCRERRVHLEDATGQLVSLYGVTCSGHVDSGPFFLASRDIVGARTEWLHGEMFPFGEGQQRFVGMRWERDVLKAFRFRTEEEALLAAKSPVPMYLDGYVDYKVRVIPHAAVK